eukprot:gene4900-biopygen11738
MAYVVPRWCRSGAKGRGRDGVAALRRAQQPFRRRAPRAGRRRRRGAGRRGREDVPESVPGNVPESAPDKLSRSEHCEQTVQVEPLQANGSM